MKVYITEKPSAAKNLAEALGGGKRGKDAIHLSNGDVVTFCFGHLVADPDPDAMGWTDWRMEDLPMLPAESYWQKTPPTSDKKKQVNAIAGYIKKASVVYHAGDSDREGQVIVDELLELYPPKAGVPVYRVMTSAQTPDSYKEAVANARPNEEFYNVFQAGIARGRADWLVGMNLTRAYTLLGRAKGYGVLSVGRVQTALLSLIVDRHNEIENFKPHPFYTLTLDAKANPAFTANWQVPDEIDGLDPEGRLIDRSVADQIAKTAKAAGNARVTDYQAKVAKSQPPMPFSLSDLSILANKKFGYSGDEVLKAAQSLYDSQVLTYPRVSTGYLPEENHAKAPQHLKMIAQAFPDLPVDEADSSIQSRAWNTKKVEEAAHHGIMPTGQGPSGSLSDPESKILRLVCERYLAQFFPPAEYDQVRIDLDAGGHTFRANSKTLRQGGAGWLRVYGTEESGDEDEEGEQASKAPLPKVAKGDQLPIEDVKVHEKETKPPKRFTVGDLTWAMVNAHRFVQDKNMRARLKGTEGIGTEATRGAIVETLKKRKYIEIKKNKVYPTQRGVNLIAGMDPALREVGTTALWEGQFDAIANGQVRMEDFLEKQTGLIKKIIDRVKQADLPELPEKEQQGGGGKEGGTCPACNEGTLIQRKSQRGNWFWACSNREGCDRMFPDEKGEPVLPAPEAMDAVCPDCGSKLALRVGKKGRFWSCTGYPDCAWIATDNKGTPGEGRQGEVKSKGKSKGGGRKKSGGGRGGSHQSASKG